MTIEEWTPDRVATIMNQTEVLQEASYRAGGAKERALAKLQLNGGVGVVALLMGASLEEIKDTKEKGVKFRREKDNLARVSDQLPWD